MAMFATKTSAALIAIVIASSLIVVSGSGIASSAFAAKKENQKSDDSMYKILSGQDKSDRGKSQSTSSADLSVAGENTNYLSTKELKKLSKCQSDAAADSDLTLGEVKDCYSQLSDQGQKQGKEDQSANFVQQGLLSLGQG